jgi:hypothetical protein
MLLWFEITIMGQAKGNESPKGESADRLKLGNVGFSVKSNCLSLTDVNWAEQFILIGIVGGKTNYNGAEWQSGDELTETGGWAGSSQVLLGTIMQGVNMF